MLWTTYIFLNICELCFKNTSIVVDTSSQPDIQPHLENEEELLVLLLSLTEDISELVLTLVEEQGRELMDMLEETKAGVLRLVSSLVTEYPRRVVVMAVISILPALLNVLRTVGRSAVRSGHVQSVLRRITELITLTQTNTYTEQELISRLKEMKNKQNRMF